MRKALTTSLLLAIIILTGCGRPSSSLFLHPEFDFQFVERVAVVPFDNLTDDKGAGAKSSRIFLAELLATRAFDVIEPGEVTEVLEKNRLVRTSELSTEQIITIGRELKVQGIFFGSVTESISTKGVGSGINSVTMVLRLVETDRGVTVWSSTTTTTGKGFWASLFGTDSKTNSEVIQDCIRKALKGLIN